MIKRRIEHQLQTAAQKMPVVTLTGPRQSGKSTLVKNIFPDHQYVNLENIELRLLAKEDPRGFLATYPDDLVIDEVQYAPDLLSYIQLEVDERNRSGQFILTGSQNLLLMESVSQSLAGRTAIFHLLPFSLEELQATTFHFDQPEAYIVKGFYPRIYDRDLDAFSWLNSYVQTYVERDVQQLINLGDAETFRQFLEICAGRIGQLVNFSDIGNLLGISYQTVKRWMNILKTSFIIYTLRPYHKNYDKRIVKTPKLYFYDTGLACALMKIKTVDQLNIHFAKGALFENFIINEIQKNFLNRGENTSFYFWQSSSKREVDLIINRGPDLFPIEIKAGKTINTSFFDNLQYFNELSSSSANNAFLIYGGKTRQKRTAGTAMGWDQLYRLPFFQE